jgi:putative phosphoesterase
MFEKLGVIADIHGNAWALEAVLRHAERSGVRRFVNLGDILYGPLQPRETYRILQRTNVVASIAGNQDRLIFDATADDRGKNQTLAFVTANLGSEPIAWLRSLPATAVIDGRVLLCHGTPASDTTYLLEDVSSGRPVARAEPAIVELLGGVQEPVVLCGHTHIPRMVQLSGGRLVVNPGSVGLPAYDDDAPLKHFMETHAAHASYAVLEETSLGWNVSFHRIAYPWDKAAKQARDLNREDWARGITTGRVE